MLTKNAYALMTGMLGIPMKNTDIVTADNWSSSYGFRYCNSLNNAFLTTSLKTKIANTTDGRSPGVAFGTGNVEPTISDYNISGTVIAGITATIVNNWDAATRTLTKRITITNNNDTGITIKEASIWGNFYHIRDDSGTSDNFNNVMYDRTVFETPLVIPAGELGVVDYVISFTPPT